MLALGTARLLPLRVGVLGAMPVAGPVLLGVVKLKDGAAVLVPALRRAEREGTAAEAKPEEAGKDGVAKPPAGRGWAVADDAAADTTPSCCTPGLEADEAEEAAEGATGPGEAVAKLKGGGVGLACGVVVVGEGVGNVTVPKDMR